MMIRRRFVPASIQKITAQRQTYADDLCQLSAAVERLRENRKNEAARVIFEHVASDLERGFIPIAICRSSQIELKSR